MTARRAARRGAVTADLRLGDLTVPEELLDQAADVWRSRELYVRYMADHGWDLPVRDRFVDSRPQSFTFESDERGASTENRRYAAIEGWGLDNGITDDGQTVDWHRLDPLRRAGRSTERTVAP